METSLYREEKRRRALFLSPLVVFSALITVLLLLFLLSLALGSVAIPLREVWNILTGQAVERESWVSIVYKVRLPRALTALSAGAALGTAGLLMQTFFRNPLADPYVLGVSSGASLGVALVVLGAGGTVTLGAASAGGDGLLIMAAGAGSAVAMGAVLVVARVIRQPITLLVLGLMFSYITSAAVSLLMHFAAAERIQAYFNWSVGSFNGVTGSQVTWFVPVVAAAAALALTLVKPLDALLLGDQYARSMGVNVGRVRLLVVAATALLTGVVTAFCGPIGFLGIAVPHVARHLFQTAEHRILIPGCLFLGSITALLASFVAEVPGSSLVLPLNAIMALIGAPVVVWVLLRRTTLA